MTSTQPKTPKHEVVHWNPFGDSFPWSTGFGGLIDSMWNRSFPGGFPDSAELEERDDAFVLDVDLPGVDKKDVQIDVTGRRVTIRGSRVETQRSGVLRHSTRVSGLFNYDFLLPAALDAEHVTATLKDGVLKVVLPKIADARPKTVTVE